MDFDLVSGKIHEMMRRDKPYQKKLILVTIDWDILQKHGRKNVQKRRLSSRKVEKAEKAGKAEKAKKGSHIFEPSFETFV